MESMRTHDIRLADDDLTLRPMTEDDWPLLEVWNNDPEVVYFAESDDIQGRPLAELQPIYRFISRRALMFIVEVCDRPIGECWLQEMNLPRLLKRFPGRALRRIDLTIGEPSLWGHGYGTRTIGLLTRLGWDLGADAIFGCDVADYNPRSRRAFEKAGFEVLHVLSADGPKAKEVCDLVVWRPIRALGGDDR